nr:hypothetical protein [Tanacetum cinerariifolium]
MRTRSSSNFPVVSSNPSTSNPKRRNRRRSKQPFILEESPVYTMDDQRTMAELLRAPTEGYAEAIVVPPILAEQFELKHSLINMMTTDQFFGLEKDNPHDHICWFNKITSTFKYKDVPNSVIKLMLYPFSLAGAARRWLEKEPPHSIHTWEVLVSKFINEFFPPSRTTNLRNEISNFQQRFNESFHEAWDRYKDLLCACPHHGFTELHQLDTFYNALNPADQDSLNAAAGGNLLERRTQDVLTIVKNKSKVRNSRNKSVVSQVKSYDANFNSSSKIAKLTHAVNQQTSAVTTTMTAILKQFQATPPPAFVKSVEKFCVTCGGAHPYYQCLAAGGNTFPELRDNIQGYVSAAAVNYNQGNSGYRPSEQSYQAPAPQNQTVPLNELEKVKRMNAANMKAMQTQINMVKNELRNEMKNSIQASLSNQTKEIKNMMASLFQMNSASTSGSGSLPSNTVANPNGELKAITTRSGRVLNGPTIPTLPLFINPEEDERVEETFTDPNLSEYTIKVPPPPIQKYKPLSQREYVVHQRDPLHPNIPYPSRILFISSLFVFVKCLISFKPNTITLTQSDLGRCQGNSRNQKGDAINNNIRGDVSRGCTYKEFLICNPKEYDGIRGAIVYTRWIEKMESVHDMSGCRDSQRVKYTAGLFVDFKTLTREEFCPSNEMKKLETELWNHAMVKAGHAAYTDRFYELARLVPYLVTPKKPKTIQKAMQLAGTLTNKALRNGTIKKNREKRENVREHSKDRNGREDDKSNRTGNAFAMTANLVRGGYMGTAPKCTVCGYHHLPETPCRSCSTYNRLGHFAKDCRVALSNVNPIKARNIVDMTCFECDIEPSDLGFIFEIEIASGQLVEIDKVFKGYKLEIKGHVLDINLIPFGSGSFDVIIGMDWFSDHKAEIICHEKVVRIPLLDGKVLKVLGEKPKEKMRQLMSAKAKEKKQEWYKIEAVKNWKAPKTPSETLEDMLRACVLDFQGSWDVHLPLVEFSYNNSYHSTMRCALFEALYGRKFCFLIIWAEVREGHLIGPECGTLWEEKELAPRFVGPFEIIEKVGPVAYRITIVKVRWNSKRGPEFTWEREDQMKLKYPHLFSADSS